MRLESAIRTSQEGLVTSGRAISVLGDNIANSTTTAFKASRVEYASLLSDSSGNIDPTSDTAIGDGVTTGYIREIQEQGLVEQTGRQLDFAVDGTGYFAVKDPATSQIYYTRAGNFSLNKTGDLVTPEGYLVQGYGPTATTFGATLSGINLSNNFTQATVTSTASLNGNVDSRSVIKSEITGTPTLTQLNSATNYLQTLDVVDSLGGKQSLMISWTKTANNQWSVKGYIQGDKVGGSATTAVEIGSATVQFDSNGAIQGTPTLTLTPQYSNGAAAGNITVSLTGYSQVARNSAADRAEQNGVAAGGIIAYEVAKDGTITGVLDSGGRRVLGTIAVADFVNKEGLQRIGKNLYFAAESSVGATTVGKAGLQGRGIVAGGSLERSTVDIAAQFTDLIVVQRAYQANSQILSATNDILKNTINLIR
jgi:flagellar hook protein FlgE